MMIYLSRWALLLTLLFVLPVALIRAQPYDDSDLRAFLTPPEGCPAPCFMGIHPGVTTTDEAIAILENHEWVAGVHNVNSDLLTDSDGRYVLPVINWKWSGAQPRWIQSAIGGSLYLSHGQVSRLQIATLLAMGDIILTLGVPDRGNMYSGDSAFGQVWAYDSWYSVGNVRITAHGFCPTSQSSLLSKLAIVNILSLPPGFHGTDPFHAACKE